MPKEFIGHNADRRETAHPRAQDFGEFADALERNDADCPESRDPERQQRRWAFPGGSKLSCGFAVVVEFQQASQPFARLDLASRFADPVLQPRKKNHILFALVISFTVNVI